MMNRKRMTLTLILALTFWSYHVMAANAPDETSTELMEKIKIAKEAGAASYAARIKSEEARQHINPISAAITSAHAYLNAYQQNKNMIIPGLTFQTVCRQYKLCDLTATPATTETLVAAAQSILSREASLSSEQAANDKAYKEAAQQAGQLYGRYLDARAQAVAYAQEILNKELAIQKAAEEKFQKAQAAHLDAKKVATDAALALKEAKDFADCPWCNEIE